jgi:hypothetical protein
MERMLESESSSSLNNSEYTRNLYPTHRWKNLLKEIFETIETFSRKLKDSKYNE